MTTHRINTTKPFFNLLFIVTLLISYTNISVVQCFTTIQIKNNLHPQIFKKANNYNIDIKKSTQLHLSKKKQKQSNNNTKSDSKYDFAIQELRFTLKSLKKQLDTLSYYQLSQSKKRNDIEEYIYTIVQNKLSPIPLENLCSNDNMMLVVGKWKLIFSTDERIITSLPKEARIVLDIKDNTNLDYILEFTTRIFALKKLIAQSSYSINDEGIMQYEYNDIVADVFGINVPTGLFGMLKGRSNYIQSIYFDGNIWIDGGNFNGKDYFNAYIRDE